MNTQLIPFQFETRAIRVVVLDDAPWWIATDVCAALDLNNVSQALSRLDDDERKSLKNNSLTTNDGVINQQLNENQLVNVVNESGVYSLIFTSRKPEAKTFKRWLTHEVIPAIRETGMYGITPEYLEQLVDARLQVALAQLNAPNPKPKTTPPHITHALHLITAYLTNLTAITVAELQQHVVPTLSLIAIGKLMSKLNWQVTTQRKGPRTFRTWQRPLN